MTAGQRDPQPLPLSRTRATLIARSTASRAYPRAHVGPLTSTTSAAHPLRPAISNTFNTPDLVKEAGLEYFCDFYHDEQPTPLATKHGPLIHVPYTMDLNDALVYRQPMEAEEFAQMIVDHFDTVYREGNEHGRVMCIALHPYMMGAPHRVKHLDRSLAYIRKHKDAWICTAEEILDWYTANGMKQYQQYLGKEA